MTAQDLVTKLKAIWHSTPLAVVLPFAALAYYWQTHGHKLPSIDEWIAGTALLATQAERIWGVFTKPANASAPKVGLVLLLGLSLGVTSCKTTGTPDGGIVSTVVSDVAHCAEQATHQAALGILDDVSTALVSGSWQTALADLVGRWGEAAVACAVQEIGGQSNHAAQASNDPTEALKASRARAYLQTHPVAP